MKPEKIYVQFYENSRVGISLSPKEGYSEYIISDFVKRMLAAQRHIDEGMPKDPIKPKSY